MTSFRLIDARPCHCGQMVRLLRNEHQCALAMVGVDSHRELRACFEASTYRKAWLIDGKLAALGGVMGSRLSVIGFVWLALSQVATRYPIAIIKEARKQLAEIMIVKRELATTIINGDEAGKRLAIFLGFHVSHEGRGQPATNRFARRDLASYVESEPECRIPIGNSYAIAMGYHREAEAV